MVFCERATMVPSSSVFILMALLHSVVLENIDVKGKSISQCPSNLVCSPTSCTDSGECIYADVLCASSCKCQCTSDGRTPKLAMSSCPSSIACQIEGCTPNGTCVFASWECKERCNCACSLQKPPASCSHSCPSNLHCSCIACSLDGTCRFAEPECQRECRCSCKQ